MLQKYMHTLNEMFTLLKKSRCFQENNQGLQNVHAIKKSSFYLEKIFAVI